MHIHQPQFTSSLLRDEVRRVDQLAIEQYGMSGLVLMENAGRGAAEEIAQWIKGRKAWLLCGRGNNAGDGFVIARHLQLLGIDAEIIQLVDPAELSGDAAANWQVAQRGQLPCRIVDDQTLSAMLAELATAEVLIDAMLGTGARGALRAPFAAVAQAANVSAALRIAIDVPSGIDCDTGKPPGVCFEAHRTITFVAAKRGFDDPASRAWTGDVTVVSIGVPRRLLQTVFDQSEAHR